MKLGLTGRAWNLFRTPISVRRTENFDSDSAAGGDSLELGLGLEWEDLDLELRFPISMDRL